MNVEDLIDQNARPSLPYGMMLNFLRAQNTLSALARLNGDAARELGITLDETAAIISYVSEDLDSLLTGIDCGRDE